MKETITKLGKQRRISLCCPNCNYFGLIDIKGKTKAGKRINYYVSCPKCGQNFEQIGRPHNFWRDIKKKYKLKHQEVRTMQREMIRKLVEDGTTKAKDRHNRLEIGDTVFIKREDSDLKSIRICKPNGNNLSD